LTNKLTKELGFKQSKVDECVYYRGKTLYVLYTDDSLLAGPDKDEIQQINDELQTKAKLSITVEGDLADFLGVNIQRMKDGTIHMSQPHLIEQILKDLRMSSESVKPRSSPAASSKVLTRHSQSPDFDRSFNYRSVIGKLNYLEKATRSDILFAVHQCARFVSEPKKEHGEAVRWLGRYLKGTKDKGTIMKPMSGRDLEVYVDASFCGDWCKEEAAMDRDTARSRHGYVIQYAGCPLLWKSQLQTEIAMSSTESEYTGLSYALRDAIPIMELLKEMKGRGYPVETSQAKVHCRVFEDNSGALEMAKIHKYRPRTKHLNVRLHHFRDYVERKEISIHDINTNDQPADYLTKALNETTLQKHRYQIMGW
jgi:Reverse transcriptase (RNA-dependent DNA polymerase)